MSSNLGNDRLSSLNINLTIWVSNQKILFFDGKFISFEIKYIWHVCRYLIQVIRYPSHRRRRHENQSAFLLLQVLFRQKLKKQKRQQHTSNVRQTSKFLSKPSEKPFYGETKSLKGGSPGQVVMGKDSRSEGRGFESQCHILDGHFSTLVCCKIVLMFVWEGSKINEKEAGMGHLF